jgi:hypothetical protein
VALIWLGIGIAIDIGLSLAAPDRVRRFGSILGEGEAGGDAPPAGGVLPTA